MPRKTYSENDRKAFVQLAGEVGLRPAMKKLKYPGSVNTASDWLKQSGVTLAVDTLKSKAAALGRFYGQQEQMYVLQSMLDQIQHKIEYDDPSADSLSKLAGAVQKLIMTMELVAGRATSRTETASMNLDAKLLEAIGEARKQNLETKQRIVGLTNDFIDAEVVE